MTPRLLVAALGVGAVAALLPAAPAAAVCEIRLPDGRCTSVCGVVGIPYGVADDAADDRLPDMDCPA